MITNTKSNESFYEMLKYFQKNTTELIHGELLKPKYISWKILNTQYYSGFNNSPYIKNIPKPNMFS